MMTGSRSLMDFVAAPLLVGDPDGRVVYVNPAFERAFDRSREDVSGQPLAVVFEGGGREAILDAVARVCSGDAGARFHMREAGQSFAALASPVEVEGGRVGVIVLLTPESGDERLIAFERAVRAARRAVRLSAGHLRRAAGRAREVAHPGRRGAPGPRAHSQVVRVRLRRRALALPGRRQRAASPDFAGC